MGQRDPSSSKGVLNALWHYISNRFPIPWLPLVAINRFLLIYLAIHGLADSMSLISPTTISIGCFSCVLLLFTQRISDDLLDETGDRNLAAQGVLKYQQRPLVSGAISSTTLVSCRRWVFAAILVTQIPLMLSQVGGLNRVMTLIIPAACYLYINHLSSKLSPYLAGSSALAFVCYAISLYAYDNGGLHWLIESSGYSLKEIAYPVALLSLIAWLPIQLWQLTKRVKEATEARHGSWREEGVLFKLLALSIGTSLALALVLSNLTLTWVLLPLCVLLSLAVLVQVSSFRSRVLHPWLIKATGYLALFQYVSIPAAIIVTSAFF